MLHAGCTKTRWSLGPGVFGRVRDALISIQLVQPAAGHSKFHVGHTGCHILKGKYHGVFGNFC